MTDNVLVPQGMLKAVFEFRNNGMSMDSVSPETLASYRELLEVALRCLYGEISKLKRFDFNPHDGEEGMELSADGDYVLFADVVEIFVSAPEPEFMECDTCRAKPGSPTLCVGCLHNREVINSLKRDKKSLASEVPFGTGFYVSPKSNDFPVVGFTEPKVPEQVKDLLCADIESGFFKPEILNERIIEAFHRGQKAAKK